MHPYLDDPSYTSKWPEVILAYRAHATLLVMIAYRLTDYFIARRYLRCPRCGTANPGLASYAILETFVGPLRISGAPKVPPGRRQCFSCMLTVRLPEET